MEVSLIRSAGFAEVSLILRDGVETETMGCHQITMFGPSADRSKQAALPQHRKPDTLLFCRCNSRNVLSTFNPQLSAPPSKRGKKLNGFIK